MRELTVRITRYSEDKGSYEEEYQIPRQEGKTVSVMNILEYIYENLDETLAFFHHAACKQAACGKCMVKLNGKTVLACSAPVEGDMIELAPYKKEVLRDLICVS